MENEKRFFPFELRAEGDSKQPKIVGHATVFNQFSEDLGGFREKFLPGAFTETIKNDDIRSLINHTPTLILGRNKSGTLRISEDVAGVYYEVDAPDTSYARDLLVSIGRRDISQCSIIFRVQNKADERWLVDGKEVAAMEAFMAMWDGKKRNVERHVLRAKLADVGPVTFPAYPQTDVISRSMMEARGIDFNDVMKRVKPGSEGPEVLTQTLRGLEIARQRFQLRK